jgi:hypothetical protein
MDTRDDGKQITKFNFKCHGRYGKRFFEIK